MTVAITQTFISGPRLIDGTDLNNAFAQANAGLALIGVSAATVNTAVTTAAGTTLTAAAITGGLITRTGPTAVFTDTTDTAAAIIAALPGAVSGQTFYITIVNKTAFTQTLAGGTGVTLTGFTVIPGNSSFYALVKLTSLTAVSILGTYVSSNIAINAAQFTTAALSVGTLAAGTITGAYHTVLTNTGATPGAQTVRTAAQMLADIPGAQVGFGYMLRIVNTGAGTLTLTADAGPTVTITGTATVAQNVFRDYVVTFPTATTATIQSVGSGVSP